MAFNVSSHTQNGTTVLALAGDLDATTAAEFQDRLDSAVQPGLRRLVLDMSDLAYLSSAGLRQLIYARQNLEDEVRMVLVGTNERVRRTIELVGFDQSVTFDDRMPE